jgi:hypothetical protein
VLHCCTGDPIAIGGPAAVLGNVGNRLSGYFTALNLLPGLRNLERLGAARAGSFQQDDKSPNVRKCGTDRPRRSRG